MAETAKDLFSSIHQEDEFGLFVDGEPDAKKVVSFLDYKKKDVAAAVDIPLASVRYDAKMPAELKKRLEEWAIAINLVGNFFKDEHKTMLWFRTENPALGHVSPIQMIRAGRFKKLLRFIQTALSENQRT